MFVDESGFQLLPSVVKTYAPIGKTPILRKKVSREKVNVISGITEDGRLYTNMKEGTMRAENVVSFLKHLQHCIKRKLLVIWDGARIHRSKKIKEFLKTNQGRTHVERIPPYSPELNPDELVWRSLKYTELGNVCCRTLKHLKKELRQAIARLRKKTNVLRSFFRILEPKKNS